MRYESAGAFRMALEQRLKTEAAETGLGLARLRKRVAFELFLRRLVQVAPDRWVLKGALALDFRLGGASRATKDIDLGRDDDEEAAIEDIAAAQRLHLDDFFTFVAGRTDAFDEVDEFQAIRFHVRAELAERVFEQFVVDIGFAKPARWKPDRVRTSDFLSFAGIEPLELPAIPLARHLAEKVHAYTRSYGDEARPSTRPKDLVDILLIADSQALEAAALREALTDTFEARAHQELPRSLPAPPSGWASAYGRLAGQVGLDPDLAAAFDRAAAFLDPVLSGETHGSWDAAAGTWAAPGDGR
ncbi:MAG TPA: nucleotidyl transferase AbiEii/AbiGii toxin family protein [Solirubrobacterales bacterium]